MKQWMQIAMTILMMTPKIVAKVEETHAQASGAEKKQAAMDWLTFGAEVASACLPQSAPLVNAVASAGGAVIDATVAIANAVGGLKATPPQAAPAAQ